MTAIPPIDPMLAQLIMSFLMGLDGLGMIPTQSPTKPPVARTAPKMGEVKGNDAFFCPLLGSVMIGNEHDMLTKFLMLKPLLFLGSETKAFYE